MSLKRKSKMKKRIVFSIIIVAIVGIVAYILFKPSASTYEAVTAKKGDITTYYSFSGNVETKNRQTVMAEKVIQISEINVKEGDIAKEGDVLITTTTGDEIKAEIGGEVVNLNIEENETVMGGIKLLEIVDYANLQINVKVDEYDIGQLKKGMETTVKIGALDKELKGKITDISKEGQVMNGVTFFLATIDLEKDESLKVGMSAEVKLVSKQVLGAVTLPIKAIQFDDDNKPYIFKENADGKAVRGEIETGINDGTIVEIKSGVSEGETILYATASNSGTGFMGGRRNRDNSDGGTK